MSDWPRPPSCLTAVQLADPPEKATVCVAGLVIVRQRPGSAKGVIFLTLEDETGVANVVVWQNVYQRFRRAVIAGRLLKVTGKIQREGFGKHAVIHVVADVIEDVSHLLDRLSDVDFDNALANADEVRRPVMRGDPRGAKEAGPQARLKRNIDAPERQAGPPKSSGGRAMHPRDQAKRLFPSRDFH